MKKPKISVFDRGFLFGDGIYEVMVQMGNDFFYGKEHLDRLAGCLKKINLDFDHTSLPKEIEKLLKACKLNGEDCLLYIQVTRGVAVRTHAFPKLVRPTLVMYAIPYSLPAINQKRIETITSPDYRWDRCDIKTTSLVSNVMANDQAATQGKYESIFIRDGRVTEASHCNVFFVKNSIVYTHPANKNILDGITRQIVIELCKKLQIELIEEAIFEDKLSEMDEAFLSGTTTQIASISKIDEHNYHKDGNAGPITKKIQMAFLNLKEWYVGAR